MKKVVLVSTVAPTIVLVRPQLAENVGMVARAMMNCGCSSLRLVAPREDHLSKAAISAASGAQEILQAAQVFASLEDAVSDMSCVMATTARLRDMAKQVFPPKLAVQKTNKVLSKNGKIAWLFGPERTGLENADLDLADYLVQIPLNPAHSSLNLSQAVLIMAYHWWSESQKKSLPCVQETQLATKQEVSLFLSKLDGDLEANGYYSLVDKKDRMKRNLHNIFIRMNLTRSELKTLYNAISFLKKKINKAKNTC